IPGRGPCLRCYLEGLPPAGSGPTCDTVGVVPTLPVLVASLGMTEVLRFATGASPSAGLFSVSVWKDGFRQRRLFEHAPPRKSCPVCSEGRFPALEGEGASEVIKLCGRRSVQVAPAARERPDLDSLERRLRPLGPIHRSSHLLSAEVEGV